MAEASFIKQWNNVHKAFGYPGLDKNIKYKRCGDFIVQMHKMDDTKDNESRIGVVDARYAKFRANKLLVLKIYDSLHCKFVDAHFHRAQFFTKYIFNRDTAIIEYKVGQIAIPNGFDEDENEICAKGIHYFNTLFGAFCYGFDHIVYMTPHGSLARVQTDAMKPSTWFAQKLDQLDVTAD